MENTHQCVGCSKPAEWKAIYSDVVHDVFGKEDYYCGDCLLEDLNGYHSGGGPTLNCFFNIVRLEQPKVEDIYYQK